MTDGKTNLLKTYFDELLFEETAEKKVQLESAVVPEKLQNLQKKKLQVLLDNKKVDTPEPLPEAFELAVKSPSGVLPPKQEEQSVEQYSGQAEHVDVVRVEPPKNERGQVKPEKDQEELIDLLEWHENGRPVWGQTRFDALLFKVAGLTLAVPLVVLGQIQALSENLSPVFGQPEWFMGLLNTPQGQIKTLNTAMFVMPERSDRIRSQAVKYVITMNGLPWGLAVDKIEHAVSLEPDEVNWRGKRSKRPWLAGTVKSAMCALIDVPQLGKTLLGMERPNGVN